MSTPSQRLQVYGGDHFIENLGDGELAGGRAVELPAVASVGAGVANTTVQARHVEHFRHRRRKVLASCSSKTAVGGTNPTVDVFATLPAPTVAPTLALVAEAGNIANGVHKVAIAFGNAAGKTTVGPTASITVADKTAAGKILVSGIECGEDGTTHRYVYLTTAGGTTPVLAATIANNDPGQTVTLNLADTALALAIAQTTGSGLNDVTVGGSYTASVAATFTIEITSAATPDVFRWKKDSGSWTTGVSVTGSAQTLSDGVTVTFAATTGHTNGNVWTITAPGLSASANGTGVTILDDPIELTGADVVLSADCLDGAAPPVIHSPGVVYTARAVTGASTGAIADLRVTLDLERIPTNA